MRETILNLSRVLVGLESDLLDAEGNYNRKKTEANDSQHEATVLRGTTNRLQGDVTQFKTQVETRDSEIKRLIRDINHLENKVNASDKMVLDRDTVIENHFKSIEKANQNEAYFRGQLDIVRNEREALKNVIQKISDQTGLADQVGSPHAMKIGADARGVIKDLCEEVLT